MPTNKRVFTLRLSDEVFDKIGALAAREHRSMTNYIECPSQAFGGHRKRRGGAYRGRKT